MYLKIKVIQILTSTIFVIIMCESLAQKSDVGLTPIKMIENHGFVSETHFITTEDSYILTFYRIPSTKPAFFLQHGGFSSSADFINEGNQSLAFFLANAGYDVWLSNARGSAFSRNHTTLDPIKDGKQFFDFSWHEMGYYDLPASIDYILKLKNEDSLYYVGHSQGTTSFLVLASTRPEYNKKIKIAHMLAPSAFMTHCCSVRLLVSISQQIDRIAEILKALQIYEVPFLDVVRQVGPQFCTNPTFKSFCEIMFNLVINSESVDKDLIPVLLTNFPSNAAIKQVIHHGQLIKTGKFLPFDYGPNENLKHYGKAVPPSYNLSKVTAPVALYYATSDNVQHVKDIKFLRSILPNVVLDYLVPRKTFNHFDFLVAKDVVNLVYKKLLEVNRNY